MNKKEVELAVCSKFIKLYNNKFSIRYKPPVLYKKEPPDCISENSRSKNDILKMEVTHASPEEEKDWGQTGVTEDFYEYPKDLPLKLEQLFSPIKNKAYYYDRETKKDLFLLLQNSTIKLDEDNIQELLPLINKYDVQRKLELFGFKEIWYVSPINIYQIYPFTPDLQ